MASDELKALIEKLEAIEFDARYELRFAERTRRLNDMIDVVSIMDNE